MSETDHPADRSEAVGDFLCPACLSDAVDRGKLRGSGDWIYVHDDGTYCIEVADDA